MSEDWSGSVSQGDSKESKLGKYVRTMEGYLLAEDKRSYCGDVRDPMQKKFLESLLDEQHQTDKLEKILSKLDLDQELVSDLIEKHSVDFLLSPQFKWNTNSKAIKQLIADLDLDVPIGNEESEAMEGEGEAKTDNSIFRFPSTPESLVRALCQRNIEGVKSLSLQGLLLLTPAQLMGLSVEMKEEAIDNGLLIAVSSVFSTEFLTALIREKRKENPTWTFYPQLWKQLTLQSTTVLLSQPYFSQDWNFIQAHVEKLFAMQQDNSSQSKIRKFSSIRVQLNGVKTAAAEYIKWILLKNEVYLTNQFGTTTLQHLLQLCENAYETYNDIKPNLIQTCSSRNRQIKSFSQKLFDGSKIPLCDIVNKAVEIILKREGRPAVRQLQKFIQPKSLLVRLAEVQLQAGGQIEKDLRSMAADIEKEGKRRKLTILPRTEKEFKREEEVKVWLRVQNVSCIEVRVYEVDLKTTLLEGGQIPTGIQSLGHLFPQRSRTLRVQSKNSWHAQQLELALPEVPNRLGLFIVDFVGQQVESRCLIRRGSITHVHSIQACGHVYSFFDERGEAVTEAQIWIDGRQHSLSRVGDRSIAVVPFSQQDSFTLVIAVGVFAYSLVESCGKEENNISLNILYFYTPQTFVPLKKARIIVHPQLKCFDRLIPSQLMQKASIAVTLVSQTGIQTPLLFDNIGFNEDDYVLEFNLQTNLKEVGLNFNGEITLMNQKKHSLSHQHTIKLGASEERDIGDCYLRQEGRNYILEMRGLNGQPIPNQDLQISAALSISSQEWTMSLETGVDGRVFLGPLCNVESLVVTSSTGLRREFSLNANRKWSSSPLKMGFKSQLRVPLYCSVPGDNFRLFSVNQNDSFLRDYSSSLSVKGESLLIEGNLPPGNYLIWSLEQITIKLEVVEGLMREMVSDSKQIVLTGRKKLHYCDYGSLYTAQVTAMRLAEGEIEFEVTHADQDTRIHVFALNFIPDNWSERQYEKEQERNTISSSLEPLQCQYYSDKTPSDQTSYVHNRQNKTAVGSNLQKPSLFLKRQLVGDTTVIQQTLASQKSYQREKQRKLKGKQSYRMDRKQSRTRQACKRTGGKGRARTYSISEKNFLFESGFVAANIKVKEGRAKCKLPPGYGNLQVIEVSSHRIHKRLLSLEPQTPKTIDLRCKGVTVQNPVSLSRKVIPIHAGETVEVSADAKWATTDARKMVSRTTKVYKWFEIEELLRWTTLTLEQRLEFYDKHMSHQLNVFVKQHDPEFYRNVVVSVVSNKLFKTFVDLYVVDDPSIMSYCSLPQLIKLNAFQVCLLVDYLSKHGKQEEALRIATALTAQNATLIEKEEDHQQRFNDEFDSIIGVQPNEGPECAEDDQCDRGGGGGGGPMMEMDCEEESRSISMSKSSSAMNCAKPMMKKAMMMKREEMKEKKKPFKPLDKTNQYTERTYYGLIEPNQSRFRVPLTPFWAQLAMFLAQLQSSKKFLTLSFIHFNTWEESCVALSFMNLSKGEVSMERRGPQLQITAKSDLVLLVKSYDCLPIASSKTVSIMQQVADPQKNMKDDQIEREMADIPFFVKGRLYNLETVISNCSNRHTELQLMIYLPEGALGLSVREGTHSLKMKLKSYATVCHSIKFYFPFEGQFQLQGANAAKRHSIVACAQNQALKVLSETPEEHTRHQTLAAAVRTKNSGAVMGFLRRSNLHSLSQEIEMLKPFLKQKDFFNELISLLRVSNCYYKQIWVFGFLHHDIEALKECVLNQQREKGLKVFQFYPYYAPRVHRFAREDHSTIRNRELKSSYETFLWNAVYEQGKRYNPEMEREWEAIQLSFAYFLVLQDRLQEAQQVVGTLKRPNIQRDYMQCYLTMSLAYPNLSPAAEMASRYTDYPLLAWRNLFRSVTQVLKEDEQQDLQLIEQQLNQMPAPHSEDTKWKIEGDTIEVFVPAETLVTVSMQRVNVELWFSNDPFGMEGDKKKSVPQVRVTTQLLKRLQSQKVGRKEEVRRGNDDVLVEVWEQRSLTPSRLLTRWLWTSPFVQLRMEQTKGRVQVIAQKRRQPGAYVKVYSRKQNGNSQFYRDGYTDISGWFQYALDCLNDVSLLSILAVTPLGSALTTVTPPSTAAYFQ